MSNGFLYSITNTLSISSLTQPPDANSQTPGVTLKEELEVLMFQPPDATYHYFKMETKRSGMTSPAL